MLGLALRMRERFAFRLPSIPAREVSADPVTSFCDCAFGSAQNDCYGFSTYLYRRDFRNKFGNDMVCVSDDKM
jgi:hypothetical protein